MDLENPAGYVLIGAATVVVIGLLAAAIAWSPAARLLGLREDNLWWFSPAGGRTQGLVLAYLAALVAVGAGVHLAVRAVRPDAGALAWTLSWVSAVVLLGGTVAWMGRLVVRVATGGSGVFDEPRDELYRPVDDALDDVDLVAARRAADEGDWRPAAALLRASLDHDTRFARIDVLAEHALRRSRWLDRWISEVPGDPQLLTLRCAVAVHRAWQMRGTEWVPRSYDAFRGALDDAEELARDAVRAAPEDPSPHVLLLWLARGQEVDRDEMDERCRALYRLAPQHQAGHQEELQYRCQKWHGSAEEMFATARRAAGSAPPGSALHLLVVTAHLEHAIMLGADRPARGRRHLADPATRREVAAAVAGWRSGPHGPSPVNRLQGHNVLAFFHWMAQDRDAARPHLELTREHLATYPWGYVDGDPTRTHAAALQWAGL